MSLYLVLDTSRYFHLYDTSGKKTCPTHFPPFSHRFLSNSTTTQPRHATTSFVNRASLLPPPALAELLCTLKVIMAQHQQRCILPQPLGLFTPWFKWGYSWDNRDGQKLNFGKNNFEILGYQHSLILVLATRSTLIILSSCRFTIMLITWMSLIFHLITIIVIIIITTITIPILLIRQ
jgi:hypothetical protein